MVTIYPVTCMFRKPPVPVKTKNEHDSNILEAYSSLYHNSGLFHLSLDGTGKNDGYFRQCK